MTLQEVQNINHEPFLFRGFGTDSAGTFISWEKGRLENSGITVDIEIPSAEEALGSTKSYSIVFGNIPVVSNEPAVRGLRCYVRSITVRR